jgi:hypothetical protein
MPSNRRIMGSIRRQFAAIRRGSVDDRIAATNELESRRDPLEGILLFHLLDDPFQGDLEHCQLQEADLRGASLRYADLAGANMTCGNLGYADLGMANLRAANLTRAELTGAYLYHAHLEGARYDARTHWPRWFDSVKHGTKLIR